MPVRMDVPKPAVLVLAEIPLQDKIKRWICLVKDLAGLLEWFQIF